jgi:hypothetical protein
VCYKPGGAVWRQKVRGGILDYPCQAQERMTGPSMPDQRPASASPEPPARHLGDLARGDQRWQVYLETRPVDPSPAGPPKRSPVAGRLHFVAHDRVRRTAWIFLEWSDAELMARFQEFSASELWRMVESLEEVAPDSDTR